MKPETLQRIGRFLDTWQPYRGGRSLANHGGEHLFLSDLRDLEATARTLANPDLARARAEAEASALFGVADDLRQGRLGIDLAEAADLVEERARQIREAS